METRVCLRRKGSRREWRGNSAISADVDRKDVCKLVDSVQKVEGVSDVKIQDGDLSGFLFPMGIKVKGNYNLIDVYSVLTNQGYAIVDSEVKR